MRLVSIAILAFVATSAIAGDHAVTFSSYSPNLELVSFNENGSIGDFRGDLKTTGTLFLQFAWDAHKRQGDVNARFVPDNLSVELLPSVAAGYYAAPVRYVDLQPPAEILEQIVGKERLSAFPADEFTVVSMAVEVVFHHFGTSAECESRGYYSRMVSVRPLVENFVANVQFPSGAGC